MRKLLTYLKVILSWGPYILWINFFYFRKYAKHPEKYSFNEKYARIRKAVIRVLKSFHVDYKAVNFEKYSNINGKCAILSNHHSDTDPLIMIALNEKPITFVSKKEAFKFPIIGNVLKALEAFSLDRENLMNQVKQIRDIVAHLKDPNKPNLCIYIEGTRNKNPENGCLEFHAGTLKFTKMAGVDVSPVVIYGSSRILSSKSYLKEYPVRIEYFDSINYAKIENFDSNLEAKKLRERFDEKIDEIRKIDFDYVCKQKLSKKRKALETIIDIKRMS